MQLELGGKRLGAGKKMTVEARTYNRSTHDLSTIKRTTMAPGTLVPLYCNYMQPGDTWDGTIRAQLNTLPTNGPLFGSFKFSVDVFQAAIRNYQQWLTNNKFNVGLTMADVKLPEYWLKAIKRNTVKDNDQVNSSALMRYLGISALGTPDNTIGVGDLWIRRFNAFPLLVYWDIFKNYYANKQEDNAYVIHTGATLFPVAITLIQGGTPHALPHGAGGGMSFALGAGDILQLTYDHNVVPDSTEGKLIPQIQINTDAGTQSATDLWQYIVTQGGSSNILLLETLNPVVIGQVIHFWDAPNSNGISLYSFPLENLDEMRENIMATSGGTAVTITEASLEPYSLPMKVFTDTDGNQHYPLEYDQEGIAVKTYQNDLFNNWIKTETQQYISDTSAISTLSGQITVDQIVLARKVYDVLNRIAISGGSYFDWSETVYTTGSPAIATTPMYMGGLIKEIVFQEINSTAATETEPLGQLAGRGMFDQKHKGGHVQCKPQEWSIIMAIASITPRIDYSQGNTWWTHLSTMDDFHKPGLDEIGFQDLITEQMNAYETSVDVATVATTFSAGKQPAWVNYTTDVNYDYGKFAEPNSEMFMVLNRRYEINPNTGKTLDLTTYIDPVKYNYIFADTKLDAQNFWVQVAFDWEVRRVMSAKQIPNL
ncbi:MAG: hypothetical protein [Microviridae sp.]|nr:MAG: hypothetical protein [Microviridae sp.]